MILRYFLFFLGVFDFSYALIGDLRCFAQCALAIYWWADVSFKVPGEWLLPALGLLININALCMMKRNGGLFYMVKGRIGPDCTEIMQQVLAGKSLLQGWPHLTCIRTCVVHKMHAKLRDFVCFHKTCKNTCSACTWEVARMLCCQCLVTCIHTWVVHVHKKNASGITEFVVDGTPNSHTVLHTWLI